MKLWKNTNNFSFRNPVVTIGTFDGVHLGHRYLLHKLNVEALRLNGESVVVTLWPHPRIALNKDADKLRYLTSMNEKEQLLKDTGVDHLVVIEFTREFANLDSCGFIKDYLVDKIGIKHLLVGYNHKFGKNREGDFTRFRECADLYHFSIEKTEAISYEAKRISSSIIRENLLAGKLDEANKQLGYSYFLQGKVAGGKRLGREIGFPTANINPNDPHKLIPRDGVYAVNVLINESTYPGMLNIGYRPTLNSSSKEKTIEVNIFNFEGDLYNQDVSIVFIRRLRDEKKFSSIEQLRQQLILDKAEATRELEGYGNESTK